MMNSVEQEICLNLEQMNIEENESRHEESEVDLARLNTYHQVPSVFDSKFETGKNMDDRMYIEVIHNVRTAIDKGINPVLIAQGSSGSYFCKDENGVMIGVFKPKNEEPYGEMNPKWGKWFHRHFFFCCFGRSCLIPNSGYLSEAAASRVDVELGLNIVPRTEIVELSSRSFYYSFFQKRQIRSLKVIRYPLKVGSFQIFVSNYKSSTQCIQEFTTNPLSENMKQQFRFQFEKLVILDYVIRNTDRSSDNWLIKRDNEKDELLIAAIDHGLAFPWKHPDNWRNYPYQWQNLPAAKVPFSNETIEKFLPSLENPDFIDHLVEQIHKVYCLDSHFQEKKFRKQMSVLRGQVFNLVDALKKKKTPAQLVEMEPLLITQVHQKKGLRRWKLKDRKKKPIFTRW